MARTHRTPTGGTRGLVKSLHATLRAPLGSRITKRALVHKLPTPRITGRPKKVPKVIAPSSSSRPGGAPWQSARAAHVQKHEHIRKARQTQIKGWRSSRKRVRPR